MAKVLQKYLGEEKNIYTIDEICARNNVTRRRLEALWGKGLGPRTIYLGARRMCTARAEKEWLESLENPTEEAQRIAGETAEMLRAKALRAGLLTPHTRRGREA